MARHVPDGNLPGLVARAEEAGATPKLYRLWCEHAVEAQSLLYEDDLVPCLPCGGTEIPRMFR